MRPDNWGVLLRRSAVGVDFGDDVIHVVELSAALGQPARQPVACAVEPFGRRVPVNRYALAVDDAGQALRVMLARAGIRARRAVVGLPSALTAARTVVLPGDASASEADWHAEAAALQMCPGARAVNFGTVRAGGDDGAGARAVQVVAVDRERVRERVAACADAGLRVCGAEPDDAARHRGMNRFPQLDPRFAVAAGLALRGLGAGWSRDRRGSMAPMAPDLLHGAQARRSRRRAKVYRAVATGSAAGLLAALVAGQSIALETAALRHLNAVLAAGNDRLDERAGQATAMRAQLAGMRQRIVAIGRLQAERSGPMRLLHELAERVPEDVFLAGLKQSGRTFVVSGYAASSERVSELLAALGQVSWLEGVGLIESTSSVHADTALQRMPSGSFSFSLRFAFRDAEVVLRGMDPDDDGTEERPDDRMRGRR